MDKFDSTVTHIVVSVDKKGALKKRTMKFMQGIMGEFDFMYVYVCICIFVVHS
jgi:hypothetical protein